MARTFFIGLDVGDAHLVRAWAQTGQLEHLGRLLETGRFTELATSAETLHVSAWPSIYTGCSPGTHGVYYTHQPAPGEQGPVRFAADQYGAPPVWERLAQAGRRCFVLDAPYTHPCAADVQQVFEWGTWAHYGAPGSTPPALLGELTRGAGRYPLDFEANQIGLGALDPTTLAPQLAQAARARGEAARWCLGRGELDLFCVVFAETHPAAHYLWPAGATPAELAERDPGAPELAGLLEVYRAVDQAIGRILELRAAGDSVVVCSGDGGGPNHAGWHLLPDVLKALGVQVAPGGASAGSAKSSADAQGAEQAADPGASGKRGLYARLRGLISPEMRQAVSRHLPATLRDALMKRNQAAEIDWAATRAYCLPTDLEGCLRINLRGREPEGIVEPGAEYEALCDDLSAALLELRNPATGRPAVRRVVRSDQVHAGARRDHLPDLIVLWEETCGIAALESERVGRIEGASPDERTGTHRPPGFALLDGPHFGSSLELSSADVLDVVPTLLALAGVPVASGSDGPDGFRGRAWVHPHR